MARKRASLRGRGTEILMGTRQDEQQMETDAMSKPEGPSDVKDRAHAVLVQGAEHEIAGAADVPYEQGDDGQELSPEWADLLQEEAMSAAGSETSALGSDIVADIDLDLPPLATTPARPNRPSDETADATSSEVEESVLEPVGEPADAAEPPEGVDDEVGSGVESEGEHAVEEASEAVEELEPGQSVGTPTLDSQSELDSALQGSGEATVISSTDEEPTPPAPMYSESYASAATDGAYVPAPTEKPEATDAVLRAKLDGLLYQQATVKPSDEDLEPDGPEAPKMVVEEIEDYEVGQPSRSRREPEILAYVGRAQRKALWDETLELYQAVPDVLTGDVNQGRALRLLQEAQDILLERPRQFDIAKFKVGQVQTLVAWRRNVNRWSNTYGWGIFIYEVVWIVALVLGVFGAELVVETVTTMAGGTTGIDGLSRLWSTMMWGGLGGVIGAFYSLYWHVAKVRDFDKQYSMWYIVQPVIGQLLGALVHLLIGSGFLTAQGVTQENQAVTVSLFPYAVACIAGFRQRFILEMIDRVIQVITPSPQREPNPVEETIEEEPTSSSE